MTSPGAYGQSFSTVLAQAISQAPGGAAHGSHGGAGGGLSGESHSGGHNVTASISSNSTHPQHLPIGGSGHGGGHSMDETLLGLRAFRQQLITSNIANADTPGYKAVDIDFQEALQIAQSAANIAPLTLSATASGHMSGQAHASEASYPLK